MKYVLYAILSIVFFEGQTQNWTEKQKIVHSNRMRSDNLGNSISIDGNTAVIGAPKSNHFTNGSSALLYCGGAYIFEKQPNGSWVETSILIPFDGQNNIRFGGSVSIQGNLIVVGAPFESSDALSMNNLTASGSAYIYERQTSGQWAFIQKIVASDRTAQSNFGHKVAINGNQVIVSALSRDINSGSSVIHNAGGIYIFEQDTAGTWSELQALTSSDIASGDYFGQSLSTDGNYTVVGADNEDEDENGLNTLNYPGSAYIFKKDSTGIWSQTQKIVSSDRGDGDLFGYGVSIDGNNLIVSAYFDSDGLSSGNPVTQAGSAYAFIKNSNGQFIETQKLIAPARTAFDQFGHSVQLSNGIAIIGEINEDFDAAQLNHLNSAGAAYYFKCDKLGVWNLVQKIVASDRWINDHLGYALGFSGNDLLIGAIDQDYDTSGTNSLSNAGAIYAYELNQTVGLKEIENRNSFNIYPNPINESLNIQILNPFETAIVSIFDLTGRLILQESFSQRQTLQLDILESSGLYLLHLSLDGETSTARFVIP